MSIQSLVDTVANRVNIDQPLAEKLTGSVFPCCNTAHRKLRESVRAFTRCEAAGGKP